MRKKQGLTLIELLVVISILLIIIGITVQSFRYFQGREELSDSTEKIINILRLAQSKTLASEGASQYGVYFDDTADPDQYTLFKGADYPTRTDPGSDVIYKVSKSTEINDIDVGVGQQVVFNRLTGETTNSGTVSLMLKSDNSKTRTIGIQSSGKITLGEEDPLTDLEKNNRLKDSRHIHFDYSRIIDTVIEPEIIALTFVYDSTTVTQNIPIASNMSAGQIYWEGKVKVNGQDQEIKIHTHRLNNPDTLFSVHRDRRFNDKALKISISGDPSVNLIEYPADGLITDSTSLFVNHIQWQ